jgi:hypothetical protein
MKSTISENGFINKIFLKVLNNKKSSCSKGIWFESNKHERIFKDFLAKQSIVNVINLAAIETGVQQTRVKNRLAIKYVQNANTIFVVLHIDQFSIENQGKITVQLKRLHPDAQFWFIGICDYLVDELYIVNAKQNINVINETYF